MTVYVDNLQRCVSKNPVARIEKTDSVVDNLLFEIGLYGSFDCNEPSE